VRSESRLIPFSLVVAFLYFAIGLGTLGSEIGRLIAGLLHVPEAMNKLVELPAFLLYWRVEKPS
jgi:hypothetical protein